MRKRVMALLLALVFTCNAWAEDKTINIIAQDLPAALRSLSGQTGVQLLFSEDELKHIQAKAISGSMSVEEALTRLLEGTNYTFRASGSGVYALQRAGAAVMLNEVTVTAARAERKVADVPASVSVLTAEELSTKNRQNVNEALRDEESLDFVAQPGVAHQVFPTIRGVGGSFAGSTTQVLVDGMAHDSVVSNVMGHGGLNFTALLDVERVEVVRGPASALYGPSTVGGVINVITKRWKGGPGAEVNGSYGTHNTQTAGAAAGTAGERFDLRLSAYDAKSDGYVAVPTPDRWGNFDAGPRAWKDTKIALMTGYRPADKHEITLNLQRYYTRSATYGGRPNEHQNMEGQSATLGYRFAMNTDTTIKADFRATRLKQQYFFDSGDWNGLTVPGVISPEDLVLAYSGGRTSNSTFSQVQLDTRPFAGNQLIAGYSHDTGKQESKGASVGEATTTSGSKSKVDALFVQDEHTFGSFTLTAGAREDRINLSPDTVDGVPKNGNSSTANVFNPRLGARYHVNDNMSFYASAGTAYLPATNSFKYVQPSTTRVDNPNLKPETSTSYEVGMNNQQAWGAARISMFHTDYKDQITLGADPASGMNQWQNIAVVKVDGIEAAFQGNFGNGWQPYTNFSYTRARDYATADGPRTQSLGVAPRKFNLGVTYEPSSVWSATLNGRAVSAMYFNDLTPEQKAGGYFIADAKISARLTLGGVIGEAFLACNNLMDKKYEPFNIGEWSDGRTFTVGLSGKI